MTGKEDKTPSTFTKDHYYQWLNERNGDFEKALDKETLLMAEQQLRKAYWRGWKVGLLVGMIGLIILQRLLDHYLGGI